MSNKRGQYRTRAATVADEAIELRVREMEEGPESWLRFCRQTLDGGLTGGVRPHANRRVERAAVFDCWRRHGVSIEERRARFEALETEWSTVQQRVIFDSRYHIGTLFGPTFIDDALLGPLRPPRGEPAMPPPDADPRFNPFLPMVRGEPFAPPSVRDDPRLLLAWIEWLGERGRQLELVNADNRSAVTRARQRIRGRPKL